MHEVRVRHCSESKLAQPGVWLPSNPKKRPHSSSRAFKEHRVSLTLTVSQCMHRWCNFHVSERLLVAVLCHVRKCENSLHSIRVKLLGRHTDHHKMHVLLLIVNVQIEL